MKKFAFLGLSVGLATMMASAAVAAAPGSRLPQTPDQIAATHAVQGATCHPEGVIGTSGKTKAVLFCAHGTWQSFKSEAKVLGISSNNSLLEIPAVQASTTKHFVVENTTAAIETGAPPVTDILSVSQSGPAFKHGATNVQIQIGGMPSAFQDAAQVPYIQSATIGKNGKIVDTKAIVTDGVTVYYAAKSLREGRINVEVWFVDNNLISLGKTTSDGMTIDLPTIDQFQYIGAIITSMGHPVTLTLGDGEHSTATLRFVVTQSHQV